MKLMTIDELNEMYKEDEQIDKDLQSEQRTNIQLVAGDHYNRSGSRYWNNLRDTRQISPEQRLRLTKNHIAKITKLYRNGITSYAPDVTIIPKNEKELRDQKAAEMHKAVLDDIKARHRIDRKIRTWAKDYVEIGELICKVFWNPDAGYQIGWRPELGPEGEPVIDPMTGQMSQSEDPVMSGDLEFETIHGFDFRRDATAKSMDEARRVGFSKMAAVKDLQAKYKDDPEKSKFIEESSTDTFRVFEGGNNAYKRTKGLCLVKELYFRPCADYRNGYFYIFTEKGVLESGELPFGIFPIIYEGFDEVTTSARHHSIIRQLRPYQIEINRAASKMAEHQVTIGDTKVFLMNGRAPSSGTTKPGIRYETINGGQPIVVPGQTGDQYLPYIESQIAEMYKIADISEDMIEINTQIDPMAMLYRSLKQKKKFSIYAEKFEGFLVEVFQVALELMKKYAPDDMIIRMLGAVEQVNMPEFKRAGDLHWQIKVIPEGDDIETKMGKQISFNNIIQYIGPNLGKDDIGKMLRLSPYLNKEKMFEDMTLEYDNAVNDILALDRGEYPPPVQYEDHKYQVKRLTSRCKQPDFRYKSPQVQQAYQQKIQEHEQAIAQEQQAIKEAEAGFIPSGGYLVVCDLYVPDPNNPKSTKRVRIPSESLQWLLKRLDQQGSGQEGLAQMPTQMLAELAGMVNQPAASPGPVM